MQNSSLKLIEAARKILEENSPMTLRQVYYQLVSRQVIKNAESQYKRLSRVLVDARKHRMIPWEWVEDRLRMPRHVPMWTNMNSFVQTVKVSFRLDIWRSQPVYVEVWCEKDALSGIFEEILWEYGVTLNVGRGYDGWSSVRNAALRFEQVDCPIIVLYFGDFDPSGVNMPRSLAERLAFFNSKPELIICALTAEDINRYDLPPAPAKRSDTRAAAFIAEHGDVSVELDALPVDVLRDRIKTEIESRLDLEALNKCRNKEAAERRRLIEMLK